MRKRAPRYESGGFVVDAGDETAAALFLETKRNASSFFLKGTEAEASGAGLRDYETAVLKQQLSRLSEGALQGRVGDLFDMKWPNIGLATGHI
jgi:hypothetical protein